jgi:hypothetical protein
MAFGHHLLEAARRQKLPSITLIVRDLSDETMLRFMGRENAEEFNADFLVMLEMWEAAVGFCVPSADGRNSQAIDAARLVGWTETKDKTDQLNATARACHAALSLISGGYLSRDDLRNMSIASAREIVERTHSRLDLLDRLGKKGGRPAREIEEDKRTVADAARSVARDTREGGVGYKNIRGEIDYRAVKDATAKQKASPLFAAFAKEVAESIHKMLVDDRAAEKLAEMERALPLVEMEEDRRALRRIDFALAEHEDVTGKWRKRLMAKGEKVVPFRLLKDREG